MGREDQQHNPAGGERIDNGFAVLFAGEDVAGRDPARDALRLKRRARGVGDLLILRRVTDEYAVRHASPSLNVGYVPVRRSYTGFKSRRASKLAVGSEPTHLDFAAGAFLGRR